MELSREETLELVRHEELLAKLLSMAETELAQHPEVPLCARQAALLQHLESAFAGQSCPPGINLLSGGLADDDYRAPRVVDYINSTDTTPRDDWRSLTPQLLRACEDSLFYLDAPAFCYVLPAYLRQYLLRPDYMCTDSIFFCLDYRAEDNRLHPLTESQREVVEAVYNEFRCRELQSNGEVDEALLPWEYERYRQEQVDASPWTFAGNLALDYAERHGIRIL